MNKLLLIPVAVVLVGGGFVITSFYLQEEGQWVRQTDYYGDINGDGFVVVDTDDMAVSDMWLLMAYFDEYGVWDVNQDGIANQGDVDAIQEVWTGGTDLYFTRADCWMDGRVNVRDIYIVIQFWNETKTTPASYERLLQIRRLNPNITIASDALQRGDVDGDGAITMEDFNLIVAYAKGEISTFPVQNVSNIPPVAVLSAPSTVNAYTPVTFDGSASYDEDGSVVAYRWHVYNVYGEEVYDSGWVTNSKLTYIFEYYPYGSTAPFTVKLEVKDDDGAVGSNSATVYVNGGIPPDNNPPVAVLDRDEYVAYVGSVITFDASASYDVDGDALEYRFFVEFMGEWYQTDWQSSPTYSLAFSTPGTGRVELHVRDIYHAEAVTNATIEVVTSLPPHAEFTWYPEFPKPGDVVIFDASASYDEDGYIRSYYWYIDGEYAGQGVNIQHIFDKAGNYTVRLTVVDDDNQFSSVTHVVRVGYQPPEEEGAISPWIPLVAILATTGTAVGVVVARRRVIP